MAWGKAFEDLLSPETNTDKVHTHRYHVKYDELFHRWRDKPIKLLEYGIDQGFSLRMWEAYFRKAKIFGVDIRDCGALKFGDRIKILKGDMSNPYFAGHVTGRLAPFDIIIDDGSHRYYDQRAALELSWKFLKRGGYYVIEDFSHPPMDKKNLVSMVKSRRLIETPSACCNYFQLIPAEALILQK
jgi:cephalosporin hydroxylase